MFYKDLANFITPSLVIRMQLQIYLFFFIQYKVINLKSLLFKTFIYKELKYLLNYNVKSLINCFVSKISEKFKSV